MDIVEFFQQSSGKWFSQRSSHHFAFKQSEGGKSTLLIEMLPKDAPTIVALCEHYGVNPTLALCGVHVTWDGKMEWDKGKPTGSTVLVLIADPAKPNQGQVLRQLSDAEKGDAEKALGTGRYTLGNDDVLVLITENETLYSEERLWFASPNLRLRTSVLSQSGGFSTASFCSEIRMGGIKPPENTTATVQNSGTAS